MFGHAGVYCLGISSIWCIATTGIKATGTAVVRFILIFSGFFDIAFTPLLYAYICEIWPYNLRARGLSIGLLSTQLAVFFNIFVNPFALKSIEWRYYFVYLGLLVIILFTIYLFYPETKGHSLEEMSMIFEGSSDDVMVDSSAVHSIAMRRASASTKNAVQLDENS